MLIFWKKFRGRSTALCLLGLSSFACTAPPEGHEWHIICHSNGLKTLDVYAKDNLIENHTNVSFIDKATDEAIILTDNCIMRAEKIRMPNPIPDSNR
ncbi:MAG: hypothetical protein NTX72_05575 [Candidatus Uhrbacteria bacterium]|nr:hypothetical protein [Candidatus Uhrbacteria bacterium]